MGIGDPPRAAAGDVVRRLERAGIRVVLVTGDHPGTASAIARQVGISRPGDQPVEGGDLADLTADRRQGLTVVARVLPDQKVHVVQWLQDAGEVVAMLGDGVNDAPALRRADIGVAAGMRGSAVAKEAADLVLTDDELGSVVAAVEEGRRILANIRAFLLFGVSGGLAEVGVMLAGGLVGLPVPLLPAQILWINLLTHGLVGIAFGSQPLDPAEMERPPRPPSESMFTRDALVRLVLLSGALTAVVLVVAGVTGGPHDVRRTAVFLTLGIAQLGVALALRSPGGALRSGERGRRPGGAGGGGAAGGGRVAAGGPGAPRDADGPADDRRRRSRRRGWCPACCSGSAGGTAGAELRGDRSGRLLVGAPPSTPGQPVHACATQQCGLRGGPVVGARGPGVEHRRLQGAAEREAELPRLRCPAVEGVESRGRLRRCLSPGEEDDAGDGRRDGVAQHLQRRLSDVVVARRARRTRIREAPCSA